MLVRQSKAREMFLSYIHTSRDLVGFQLPLPKIFSLQDRTVLRYHLNSLDLEIIFTVMIREIKVISVGPSILRFQFVVVPDRPPLIIKTSSQGGDGLTRVLAATSTTGKHIDDSAGRARNVFLDGKRNSST